MTVSQHIAVSVGLFATASAFGSFLNVVIHRLPRGRSLWHPPSACPTCERRIAWRDNVPILAWLWLRGRCRNCGSEISARYPLVEAVCGLLAVGVYLGAAGRAGGDVLEVSGGMGELIARLMIALGAAAAGWLVTETARSETSRLASWLAVAPSLLIVAWSIVGL